MRLDHMMWKKKKKKEVPKHMLRHYGGLLVTVQTKLIKIQCCYHLNILIIIVKNYKLSKIDWWWMNESWVVTE